MSLQQKIIFISFIFLSLFIINGEVNVEIKKGEPYWYMYMEFKGSMSQTPEKIRLFFNEVGKQKLQSSIRGHLFALYYSDRSRNGMPRLDIGIKVPRDTRVKPPIKIAEYNFKIIAVYTHIGLYELVGNTLNVIFSELEDRDFVVNGPIMIRWLDENPDQIKPEERRTEIIIPVNKKSK